MTERARDRLLGLQDEAGWWKGDLRDQRDHGRRGPAAAAVPRHPYRGADRRQPRRWIRSQQRADGSWATFHGGPGDLSTTIEAYIGAAARRRRRPTRRTWCGRGRFRPGEHGGIERQPGLHPLLAGALRPLALARPARGAAGAGAAAAAGCRSTSTTSPAGRGRPSSRSSMSGRCARCATSASTVDELRIAAAPPRPPRLRSRPGLLHRGDRPRRRLRAVRP